MKEVLFKQKGQLGFITLNRAEALNALTLDMIKAIQTQLLSWQNEVEVQAVVLQAAGEGAFCAGGDVRWLYHKGLAQQFAEQSSFFWHEYRLNHFIHHYKKPFVALMDGVVMGGGVGLAMHGSHPIAGERFVFAMPETSIGFFPDVGASHLLTGCPGYLGIYLGLTGKRINAAEAYKVGLVKQVLSSASMPELIERLQGLDLSQDAHEQIDELTAAFHEPLSLKPNPDWRLIDLCFNQPEVELIQLALQAEGTEEAKELVMLLNQKAPLSLKLTLEQFHKAKNLSLAQCLSMDYTLTQHLMQTSDFYEGVRALLIDKDKKPQWKPASLSEVSTELLASYFEQLSDPLEFINLPQGKIC